MTIYYVDQVNGNNANNGTSAGTAWRDLSYADGKVADGDTLNIIAPATAPLRDYYMQIFNDITTQGNGGSKAYLLGTADVSHGATIGELARNGGFDGWYDATTPWKHLAIPTGSVSRDGSIYASAPYSAGIVRTTSDVYLASYAYLNAGQTYTLSFKHRQPSSGQNIRLKVKRNGAEEYLIRMVVTNCANNGSGAIRVTIATGYDTINGSKVYITGVTGTTEANGTWTITRISSTQFDLQGSTFTNAYVSGGAADGWVNGTTNFALYEMILPNSNAVFTQVTRNIPVGTSDQFNITWRNPTNSTTFHVDDLSIVDNATTYSWSLYSGTTYKLNQALGVEVTTLLKSTAAAWTSSGVDALAKMTKGATKDTLNAGEWIWDTGVLYYRLAGGETDITTLHFEATRRYSVEIPNDVDDLVTYSGSGGVLRSLDIVGAKSSGIWQTASALRMANVQVKFCGVAAVTVAGDLLSGGDMLVHPGMSGGLRG